MRMGCDSIIERMLSMLQALGTIPSVKKQERGHIRVIWKVSPAGSREWKESWDLTWARGAGGATHRRQSVEAFWELRLLLT